MYGLVATTSVEFEAGFGSPIPMVSYPPDFRSLHAVRLALCRNVATIETSLGGGKYGHIGLVLSPTFYETIAPGTPYIAPSNPGRFPIIPEDASEFAIGALERAHEVETYVFEEYRNLHVALKAALCKSVHPIFLSGIAHRYIGHMNNSLQEMFAYLFDTYARMDDYEITRNFQRLHEPWDNRNTSLVDLRDKLLEIQDMAVETSQPISDSTLISAFYTQVYASGDYDDQCKTWRAKPAADRTSWANLLDHFRYRGCS